MKHLKLFGLVFLVSCACIAGAVLLVWLVMKSVTIFGPLAMLVIIPLFVALIITVCSMGDKDKDDQ